MFDKILVSTDPVNNMAFVRAGVETYGFRLDPWPETDEEVRQQAFARVPDQSGDISDRHQPGLRKVSSTL